MGLVGLGTMGRNLALNLAGKRFSVALWNKERGWAERVASRNPDRRLVACRTLGELVGRLARPRRVLLMVTAGPAVDEVLRRLVPLLSEGDVVADGGNSFWRDTERRSAALRPRGIPYLGVGISGGAEGALRGPAVMAGGTPRGWVWFKPVFSALAARGEEGPCAGYFGSGGAGHFVKMVHNGIEYADLQAIAEAFDLLRAANGLDAGEVSRLFRRWDDGPLGSFLLKAAAETLAVREVGGFLVDRVVDAAGQKGTGGWTVREAADLGVPVPSIAAAVDARTLSSRRSDRSRLAPSRRRPRLRIAERDLKDALLVARLAAFAQGLDLLRASGARYGWEAAWAEAARVWGNGCIIRARLLEEIRRAARRNPVLPHLFLDPGLRSLLMRAQGGGRRAIAAAVLAGVPAGALSAGLSYWDAFRAARLPQDLVQLARDRFGAHGFGRTDRPGVHHGPWHEAESAVQSRDRDV